MDKTGGPAFPVIGAPGAPEDFPGMTLRDYFAAQAPDPQPWWIELNRGRDRARNPHNESHKPIIRSELQLDASWRYEYADAMLAERSKNA